MKVVLQDRAKAAVNGTVPRSNWSAFSNSRPSTTRVPGQATGVCGVSVPVASSAVALIVFMLEPGGYRPENALPAAAASLEDTATISPVPGRTTTRWVGSCWVATAASAAVCTARTNGVCTGSPGTGSTASTSRPASPVDWSGLTTLTVNPGGRSEERRV